MSETPLELLSFRIGASAFCVAVTAVREIRGWLPVTPLPHAPDFVCGVVNLRGTILPIIDLAARLGLGRTEPTPRHAIIVTEAAGQPIGLLVDGVNDIMSVAPAAVHPTPDVGSQTTASFVRGVLTIGDTMVSLIELDRVLPDAGADSKIAA